MFLSPVPTLRRKKGTEELVPVSCAHVERKKGTEKLVPVSCAHAEAEEGHREACSCLLCPRLGGRRAQRSFFLSPVPTLRRKKGTEKLAPVSCAHAGRKKGTEELVPVSCAHSVAQEGTREELVWFTATLRYEHALNS